jgi:signal transduction histidine kinase/ligand-binding sensor domain-containing protein/DNA-binding response OmpR family regulator
MPSRKLKNALFAMNQTSLARALRGILIGLLAVDISGVAGAVQASTLERLPALPGTPGYVHEVFSTDDGLPVAGIGQSLQTRDGFLWLATFDGLARFDGARFEVFDSERVPALGSNRIFDLREARDGTLWIRSEQGHLVRYTDGAFNACPQASGGRADCSLTQAGAPGYTLLEADAAGALWARGPGGAYRVEGHGLRAVSSTDAAAAPVHDPVRNRRALGPGGEVWTVSATTLARDGRPVLSLRTEETGGLSSVSVSRDGTVWIAALRGGKLHALRPARLAAFVDGLPSPNVYPIYEDRDGTIWAGGTDSLAVLPPSSERFRPVPNPAGPGGSVYAFLRDRAGVFWVGTSRGLYLQGTQGPAGFVPAGDERLRSHSAAALFEDSRSGLWVGTEAGLFHREPAASGGSWRWLRAEDGLPFPWIRVIRETTDGSLWIGTNGGGVIRYAAGRFSSVTQRQGLASDLVRSLYVAPDGHLWVGTENRGLSRLTLSPSAPAGVAKISGISERQGLYANGIHQMVADGLGNLWMGSNRGIFRARLADLDAVADGRLARLDPVAYTERDGMPTREANGSVQDAGFRDREGRIWFPTQAGLVRLDPRALLTLGPPPQVYIEGVRTGKEERPLGHALRLPPPQRSFVLELTAPSFLAPERQRFRYRLLPYDHGWIEAGASREAAYSNVPPGRYRFEVRAAGPDGGWSPAATLPVEVVPRFFETAWFRALGALLAAVAAVGLIQAWGIRQRVRRRQLERLVEERTATMAAQAEKLRELDDLKSQFFANVSHELRTPLTLTLGPLQDALDGRFGPLRADLAQQIELAQRNAQRLLGLVDQLLDVVRINAGRLDLQLRRGDLAAVVRQRVEAFLPLAERRGIELSLAAPAERVGAWFDEVQIEKVLDNLLGNALKFTPRGGHVSVAFSQPSVAGQVGVSVRDSGPGIPAGQLERIFERFYQVEATARRRWPGAGIGLALARQLADLHGGAITVESAEGEGACFTVCLWREDQRLPEGLAGRVVEPAVDEEGTRGGERRPAGTPTRPLALPAETPDEPQRPYGLAEFDRQRQVGDEADDERTTVLVVDDHQDVRAYIRRHLEPEYRVVEAADGLAGLEAARRRVPDLVVSDVMMPGLDGNALLRKLREDPELEFVPVVLLTARASPESRIQGFREGVDDYLVKPFDPRELKARVANLIASRKRWMARFEGFESKPQALRVSEINVTSADKAFLARVQGAIEERLGDSELTVENLAEALACDRSYLLRKLRSLTGETPSGLIRSLRLQRAEQLLRAGAGSVSEVAYGVGFKSVAHFSNAFQEQFGERPSAFAARHRSSH